MRNAPLVGVVFILFGVVIGLILLRCGVERELEGQLPFVPTTNEN